MYSLEPKLRKLIYTVNYILGGVITLTTAGFMTATGSTPLWLVTATAVYTAGQVYVARLSKEHVNDNI